MRLLLKTVGALPLGDRYVGKISYSGGLLSIGPDEGRFAGENEIAKRVPIK